MRTGCQVSLPTRLLRRTGPAPPRRSAAGRSPAPNPGGPLSAATALVLAPGGGPLLVGGADGRVLVMPRDSPDVDTRAGTRYGFACRVGVRVYSRRVHARAGHAARLAQCRHVRGVQVWHRI